MRKIKEVLRLRLECKLSLDGIARALSLSKGVVAKYVKSAEEAGLTWDAVLVLDETSLASREVILIKKRSNSDKNSTPLLFTFDYFIKNQQVKQWCEVI